MEWQELFGIVGSLLVFFAYFPQIKHLIKEKCSAGISIYAYGLWLAAALLMLVYAIMIKDVSFIALQAVNVLAISVTLFYSKKYEYGRCATHAN